MTPPRAAPGRGLAQALLGAATAMAQPAAPAAPPSNAAEAAATLNCAPTDLARRALAALNAQRALGAPCGGDALPPAPPLAWVAAAERAAAAHAHDMAAHGQLRHPGSDGSLGGERLRRAGHVWASWAENLGQGPRDVDQVVAHWMASPSHCANMMNPRLTDMGMACRQRPGQAPYWALTLARPAPWRGAAGAPPP